MTQLGAIVGAKTRIAGHAIAAVRSESKLKVAVVSVSALALWVGAFLLARAGFGWLEELGDELLAGGTLSLGDLIMGRLLSLFALVLLFMLIFSNVLVSFSTIYRSREVAFLIQSPLSWRTCFLARFWECVVFSSWSSAFLGSPVLLAYGLEGDASPLFYLAAVVFYLPFVVVPAALGALLTVVLVRLLARLPKGSLVALAAVVLVGLFALFRERLAGPELTPNLTLTTLVQAMGRSQNPYLPSFWAARGVLAAAGGDLGASLFSFLLLLSNALFFTWLATQAAARWFHSGWSSLAGLQRDRTRRSGRGVLERVAAILAPVNGPVRALVLKDLKVFWRDPAQWSQFVLFFGIMTVYVANMRASSSAYEQQLWQSWITLLNLTACMLILATLTTRFIFPLVSLEGRRFWILGLAPISMRQIVWQKFWLSVGSTSIFTVGLVALSSWRLRLALPELALSLFGICATNLALSGLAVGLGSLYPNFQEDNPARIVSGLGGTLNFILSIAYILLAAGAQTLVLHWSYVQSFTGLRFGYVTVLAAVLGFIAGLTLLACLLPLRLGLRSLRSAEL